MKAFVSYVSSDGPNAHDFIVCLKNLGFNVSNSLDQDIAKQNPSKKGFQDALNKEIKESDFLVIITSEKYESSSVGQQQSQSIRLHHDISNTSELVIVNIHKKQIPAKYWQYKVAHANRDYAGGLSYFKRLAQEANGRSSGKTGDPTSESDVSIAHLKELSAAFRARNLTIVCGAGVSIDAGLPGWSGLLDRLLVKIISQLGLQPNDPEKGTSEIEAFKSASTSALIVGRYLKAMLKDDFHPIVRDALYEDTIASSDIINAIVDLATPSRTGATLDSIITFNFDNLIEECMEGRSVAHRPVYREGDRNSPDEIGVYHVHGYLPRKGKIDKDTQIVFSEDAYHDQFGDPFSWANLIQLAKYGQSTCLFVGLSLSDPNLRRLLDVSHRRDPQQARRHFIIQIDDDHGSKSRLVESMKSSDASELGLTSIRLSSFEEIALFLRQITKN